MSLPDPTPNPYEDSLCQETNSPLGAVFAFFPPSRDSASSIVGRLS
jgi:hypothetical protein